MLPLQDRVEALENIVMDLLIKYKIAHSMHAHADDKLVRAQQLTAHLQCICVHAQRTAYCCCIDCLIQQAQCTCCGHKTMPRRHLRAWHCAIETVVIRVAHLLTCSILTGAPFHASNVIQSSCWPGFLLLTREVHLCTAIAYCLCCRLTSTLHAACNVTTAAIPRWQNFIDMSTFACSYLPKTLHAPVQANKEDEIAQYITVVNEINARLASQLQTSRHVEDSQPAVSDVTSRHSPLIAVATDNAAANNATAVIVDSRERDFAAAAVARQAAPADMTATDNIAADPSPHLGKERRVIAATKADARKRAKPHAAKAPATHSNTNTDTPVAHHTRSKAAKAAAAQRAAGMTAAAHVAAAEIAAQVAAAGNAAAHVAAAGTAAAGNAVAAGTARAAAGGVVHSPARSPGKLGCMHACTC